MKKITKHVSYKEGTYSATALRKGLDNTPNADQLKCMHEIAKYLFEPLREWVGGPIKEMYHYIKDNLDFDQLIWEFGDDENPNWIHVSWVSHRKNRKKLTIAYRDRKGRTRYKHEAHK